MYIDSHTHLNTDKLFKNWQKYMIDFEKIWWGILINSGADEEYNKNWLTIAQEYNWDCIVKATLWFHPYEAICGNITNDNIKNKIEKLRQLYIENKEYIVAIWECGIDTHYDEDLNMELQKKLFTAQLELAKKFNLPIVIHSREDFDTTIEILKEYKELKIYIHCRWYWPNEIKIVQDMFPKLRIWFDGNISYPKAQNIRDSLNSIDLDKILLETDAPYLTPQVKRWETNYPSNVRYIYDFVAEQLDMNLLKLKEVIKNNTDILYFNK